MKRISEILLIIILIFSMGACGKNTTAYTDGLKAYQAEKYEESINDYLLAISQGNTEAVVYADLALSYLKAGKVTQALENINEAYGLDPDDPAVNKKIGMFYEAQGDLQTALYYYERSITTPQDAMSQADLETCGFAADIERNNGNPGEAIRIYNLLIEQDYYVTEHIFLCGLCYMDLKQTQAACQYFDMLKGREDSKPEYYLMICQLMQEADEPVHYDEYFAEGETLCGINGSMSLGEYYSSTGLFDQAMEKFDGDTSESARLAEAAALMAHGRYEEAEQLYVDAIRDGGDVSRICNQYLILKAEQGEYTTAFQLLSEVKLSDDDIVRANGAWNEVILFERTGDYETAFSKLRDFMTTYPSNEAVKREYAFLKRIAN